MLVVGLILGLTILIGLILLFFPVEAELFFSKSKEQNKPPILLFRLKFAGVKIYEKRFDKSYKRRDGEKVDNEDFMES